MDLCNIKKVEESSHVALVLGRYEQKESGLTAKAVEEYYDSSDPAGDSVLHAARRSTVAGGPSSPL